MARGTTITAPRGPTSGAGVTSVQGLGYNPPAGTASPTGYYEPSAALLDYYARGEDRAAQYTRLSWTDAEAARQFDKILEATLQAADQQYRAAMAEISANQGIASMDAQTRVQVAQESASAAIEAAQIASEASKYDADTRLQIAREANQVAREQLGVERGRIAAEEFGRPSEWRMQEAFMRGWAPEDAAGLKQGVMEGIVGTPSPLQAPQAVVGERGPELATATGHGTLISPLDRNRREQYMQNLPRMAEGGFLTRTRPGVRTGALVTPLDRDRSTALRQQVATQVAPSLRVAPRQTAETRFPLATGLSTGTPYNQFQGNPNENIVVENGERIRILPSGARQHLGAAYGARPLTWANFSPNARASMNMGMVPQIGQQAGESQAQFASRMGGGIPSRAGGVGHTVGTPTGVTTGPAGGPASIEPTVGTPGTSGALTDRLLAEMQQPNQASFGAWTGPATVRPPWQYNLQEWQALPYAQRAMMAGEWRRLGMIAGETEAEVMALAEEAIRRSAWTGGAPAVPSFGGW